MRSAIRTMLACLLLISGGQAGALLAQPPSRAVAVTIDDLPVQDPWAPSRDWIIEHLLGALLRNKVPAIGFVNEINLYGNDGLDPERVKLLKAWTDAGFELGNHEFAHADLNRTSLADFEEGILRGEEITRKLMEDADKSLRYFRHPYLHTGDTPQKCAGLNEFLASHGYEVAPVTIYNMEWKFAIAYKNAINHNDYVQSSRVKSAYLEYMNSVFEYNEKLEEIIFGRNINNILLLHSNLLTASTFDDIAAMIRARGYRIISIEEAMTDPVYARPASCTVTTTESWIIRWAAASGFEITNGIFAEQPRVPKFIDDAIAGQAYDADAGQ